MAINPETEIPFCLGPIQFGEGDAITVGHIKFPCGARFDTGIDGIVQLPYKYQLLTERARVAKCCYWRDNVNPEDLDPLKPEQTLSDEPEIFSFETLDSREYEEIEIEDVLSEEGIQDTPIDPYVVGGWRHENYPSFYIIPFTLEVVPISGSIPTKCSHLGAEKFNQGTDTSFPCNGSKTKCPFYTGPNFQYINDEDFEPGKPIVGEMVQELRSLMIDWNSFEDPEEKWINSFEIPFIWGKDFDNDSLRPMVQGGGGTEDFNETSTYTWLTRIKWNIENSTAELTDVVSSDAGAELEPDSPLDPPSFPTIISELGETNTTPVKINFPPGPEFTHYQFNGDFKLFIAGTANSVSNIYIINTAIASFTINEGQDEGISESIQDLLYKGSCGKPESGLITLQTTAGGYWESQEGIELKPNTTNLIYALTNRGKKWFYDKVLVNFKYGAIEVVQTSTSSSIMKPSSDNLIWRLLKLNNTQIQFSTIPIAGDMTTIKAYHYYTYSKDISRFISGKDTTEEPNLRSWSISKTSKSFSGTGNLKNKNDSENMLRWIKLDKCNRYLIELVGISRVIPMGIDRSWEPISIVLGEDKNPIELKVSSNFGRSFTGRVLPSNCMIVEPKNNIDIGSSSLDATITVELEVYEAIGGVIEEDASSELISKYGLSKTYSIGGVSITPPSSEDKVQSFGHEVTVEGTSIEVSSVSRYDLSYVIELEMDGVPIGRKWFSGVVELAHSWARDFDITYVWGASQKFISLQPSAYWAGVKGLGNITGEESSGYVTYYPRCCDQPGIASEHSALYYPYDNCEQPTYRGINTFGLSSAAFYVITAAKPVDEKYRGPNSAEAFIYHHNVLSAICRCIFEFSWGTFFRTGSEWLGFGRVRGPVSPFFNVIKWLMAVELGGTLPQFGNCGRDHVRVIKTMHYRQFMYLSNGIPSVGTGWLPSCPYIGSNSIFDDGTKARNILDQCLEGTSPNISMDLSYQSGRELLEKSTPGSDVLGGPIDSEEFVNERKKFNDVYKVKKVRDAKGYGSMWPPQGFYHNFKSTAVVWAFPEKDIPYIFRDWDNIEGSPTLEINFLTGVSISKPTEETSQEKKTDKFGRPIHLAFPEGEYTLTLKDQKYDSDGALLEYASINIESSVESVEPTEKINKIYFDRFTGEIKYDGYYYNAENKEEISGSLGELPISLYFDNPKSPNEPNSISGIDYFKVGNLVLVDPQGIRTYSDGVVMDGGCPIEDILDSSCNDNWVGFLPSLNIDNITPNFLPQMEVLIEQVDYVNAKIKFTIPPGDIEKPGFGILYDSITDLTWGPLNNKATTISIKLNPSVLISTLDIGYSLTGDPLISDPEFKISLESFGGENIILVSKPRIKDTSILKDGYIERQFIFSYTQEENSEENIYKMEDPIRTTQINIYVGNREGGATFSLDISSITCLVLNEISESIIVTEARFYLTTGLSEEDNYMALPAQDPSYISSIVSSPDMADPLEAAGIAEFWRPPIVDKENSVTEVATIGKLKKSYAGKFSTYDTQKYYDGVTDGSIIKKDPMVLEDYQGKLIDAVFTKATGGLGAQFLQQDYNLYISPYDNYILTKLGKFNMTAASQFKLTIPDNTFPVSRGSRTLGWQEEGTHACVDSSNIYPPVKTCPDFAYAQDAPGYCRGAGASSTYSILESAFWWTYQRFAGDERADKTYEDTEALAEGTRLWKYKYGSDPKRKYRE